MRVSTWQKCAIRRYAIKKTAGWDAGKFIVLDFHSILKKKSGVGAEAKI